MGGTVGTFIKDWAHVTQWVGGPTSLGGRAWPPSGPPIPPGLRTTEEDTQSMP
ncbi:Hypothetical protein FKW44_020522 [Caligus rogercresseyi]|uniref:Uncharacterized protein n=1 Tax=Caligus rogercresseyi TaxID=217165 RepID=A0A7T8GXD5_CALRO|nr:Hypothetical protein FKW44_020522 [Caligus rogercresseyi]